MLKKLVFYFLLGGWGFRNEIRQSCHDININTNPSSLILSRLNDFDIPVSKVGALFLFPRGWFSPANEREAKSKWNLTPCAIACIFRFCRIFSDWMGLSLEKMVLMREEHLYELGSWYEKWCLPISPPSFSYIRSWKYRHTNCSFSILIAWFYVRGIVAMMTYMLLLCC